jgi:integrase
VPDRNTLKGKRDFVILAVLIYCALRRSELARLDISMIQLRENRWVIADLVGKRNRVRTVPMPTAVKSAVDQWTSAAEIAPGRLLRRFVSRRSDIGRPERLGGVARRRNFSPCERDQHQPARSSSHVGSSLSEKGWQSPDLKEFLGHASIVTTDRYVGNGQEIATALNEDLRI